MNSQQLDEALECSVCLERLDHTNRMLPACQHTFCLGCLEEIVASGKPLCCPECRTPVDVPVASLRSNITVNRLLESLKPVQTSAEPADADSPPKRPRLQEVPEQVVGAASRRHLQPPLFKPAPPPSTTSIIRLFEPIQPMDLRPFEFPVQPIAGPSGVHRDPFSFLPALQQPRIELFQPIAGPSNAAQHVPALPNPLFVPPFDLPAPGGSVTRDMSDGRIRQHFFSLSPRRLRIGNGFEQSDTLPQQLDVEPHTYRFIDDNWPGGLPTFKVGDIVSYAEAKPRQPIQQIAGPSHFRSRPPRDVAALDVAPLVPRAVVTAADDLQRPPEVEPTPANILEGILKLDLPVQHDFDMPLDLTGSVAQPPPPSAPASPVPAQRQEAVDEMPDVVAAETAALTPPQNGVVRVARAKFTYQSNIAGDLSFEKGALIRILRERDANWLQGQWRGKTGNFPGTYVERLDALPSDAPTSRAVCASSVEPADQKEPAGQRLRFEAGDEITIVNQVNADWLTGVLDEYIGILPKSSVKLSFPAIAFLRPPSQLPASPDSSDSGDDDSDCIILD